MSMNQQRDGGALFKNNLKERAEQPDYRGELSIGGTTYALAGWIRKSSKGETYMSLSIKPKNAAPQRAEMDNAIPF